MNALSYKLAAIAALSVAFVGTASAATNWEASHPRRAEVNHRLADFKEVELCRDTIGVDDRFKFAAADFTPRSKETWPAQEVRATRQIHCAQPL